MCSCGVLCVGFVVCVYSIVLCCVVCEFKCMFCICVVCVWFVPGLYVCVSVCVIVVCVFVDIFVCVFLFGGCVSVCVC